MRTLYLNLLLLLCLQAGSFAVPIAPNPETERLMEVILDDGSVVNTNTIIYQTSNDWALPLGQLSESLGLAIRLSNVLGMAEGFVLQESRIFQLNLRECSVTYDGQSGKYPCEDTTTFEGEIFVKRSRLEKWLPIKISVNPLRSQVIIYPKEKLPEQLSREREALAERSKGFYNDRGPRYPTLSTRSSLLEFPFFDAQLSYLRRFGPESGTPNTLQHTTQLGGEMAGLDSYALLSGNEKKIDRWRIGFSKSSPEGKLMGPLGITQAQFFDVDLPSLPLISNTKTGRGFLLSSFDLDNPINYGTFDFQGTLPPGWEVVIYRNDVLLDRQLGGTTSRYLFKNVPLLYGRNLFKLAFFGPHGERNDEYKVFQIDPNLIRKKPRDYRLGLGFLENGHESLSFQFDESLGRFLSARSGLSYERGAAQQYGYLGIVGFNELFLFSATCAFSTLGGKSCEWSQQMAIANINLGLKYNRLFNYTSEILNIKPNARQESQLEANLNFVVPLLTGISLDSDLVKKNYRENTSDTFIRQRLTIPTGAFLFSNRLQIELGAVEPLIGTIEAAYLPSNTRFRTSLDYDTKRLRATEIQITHVVQQLYSADLLVKYQFEERKQNAALTLTRRFRQFSIGLSGSEADFRNYAAGLIGAFSFVRDARQGNFHSYADPIVILGAASVLTFLDRNRNGVRDPNEEAVPNVPLVFNQREGDYTTDDSGQIFIPYLKPFVANSVAVSPQGIEDPFLRAARKGLQFFPRPSKTTQINFPMEFVGQIDGYITSGTPQLPQPKRGIRMELVNASGKVVAKSQSDLNGFYSFEDVLPDTYHIRIERDQLARMQLKSVPSHQNATVADKGSFESNKDFHLSGS